MSALPPFRNHSRSQKQSPWCTALPDTYTEVHWFRGVLNTENQLRFVTVVMCAAEQECQMGGV